MDVTLRLDASQLLQQLQASNNALRSLQASMRAGYNYAASSYAAGGAYPTNWPILQNAYRQNMASIGMTLANQQTQAKSLLPLVPPMVGQGGQGGQGSYGSYRAGSAIARAMGAGRFSSLAGLEAAGANPVTLALGVAIAAIYALTKALEITTSALTSYGSQYYSSGGTAQETASIKSIAAALGMDPSAVAEEAGKSPAGATQWLAQLKLILSMKDKKAQFYTARAMGYLPYLPLQDLPPDQLKEALAGKGFGYSDRERQEGRELENTWGKIKNLTEHFIVHQVVTSPAFKILSGKKDDPNVAAGFGGGMTPDANKKIIDDQKKSIDKLDNAANKFDKAVNNMTKLVGVFGGIDQARAKGAYPQAWAWWGIQQAALHDARSLGAFTQ